MRRYWPDQLSTDRLKAPQAPEESLFLNKLASDLDLPMD